ncbi:arsenate reductase family protein [Bizionia paragorgiae]|jgi:arsenate reductase (glutaredoxin)|uniref:Arsenate reductase, glutaredoxin family n=1 Tax=Bizionia paragorgiae TaxID=283786 RepID=A0A1H3YX16_BIZPA|nr:ArsC/Spx/MgsR family protein [Bizionia paragorgiae]MDX1271599.1 ArsC/Spx/MgsR family protein [Bizionia paragorgiae]SEA15751.1 Arsenate reductase, glutaredoxin family [Bizionia paragorgiae]
MKKVYYLKTCSTCSRILKELNLPSDFVLQDIKSEPITEKQLEQMGELAGSYEALFSRRATLYKTMDLKNKSLTESDYKNYILEHYTFLSRPVFIINNTIYIGNSKKNVEAVKQALNEV